MSMYSLVFGRNPQAARILGLIGRSEADFYRFRDCFVAGGRVCVYTRGGGGNREDWDEDVVRAYSHYSHHADDEFDRTYCTIYFDFPEEHSEELRAMDTGEGWDPSKRWIDRIRELKRS